MKKILLILFLALAFISPINSQIYISPTGNDNTGDGTITRPWRTFTMAWNNVTAGGTIYVRGGIYTYSMVGQVRLANKSGTAENPIKVWNYPGETPIIDFLDYPNTSSASIMRIENVSYLHMRGIRCRHLLQPTSGSITHVGIRIAQNVNNCVFMQCTADHIGGWGFVVYGGSNTPNTASSNNIFWNCDSHHISDRYSTGDPWGGSDGFLINSYNGTAYPSMNNIFRGCRSYWNSDDGWDNRLFNGSLIYEDCWAFWNGYRPGETVSDPDQRIEGGNGYGFKLGSKYTPHTAEVLRVMFNCTAFENRGTGIQLEHSDSQYDMGSRIYNNTAYGNGSAGFSHGPISVGTTWLRNNLSFSNGYDIVSNHISIDDDYNASTSSYWYRRDFIPVASDFVSLNSIGVDGPRQDDGSLPDLNFLKLASGSQLINVGANVELPYDGSAPDIGAFEFIETIDPPDPPDPPDPDTIPVIVKVIKNNGNFILNANNRITIKSQ